MDIEDVADEDPTAIARLHVDPLIGYQDFHGRRLCFEAGVDGDLVRPIGAMLGKLYDAFVAEEATLVEVNPLVVLGDARSRRSTRRSRSTTTRSSAIPTTTRCATSGTRTRRRRSRASATSPTSSSTATSGSSATAPGS